MDEDIATFVGGDRNEKHVAIRRDYGWKDGPWQVAVNGFWRVSDEFTTQHGTRMIAAEPSASAPERKLLGLIDRDDDKWARDGGFDSFEGNQRAYIENNYAPLRASPSRRPSGPVPQRWGHPCTSLRNSKGETMTASTDLLIDHAIALDGKVINIANPVDTSQTLHAYAIRLNDALPTDRRQQLKAYRDRFVGTAGQPIADKRAAYMCVDWLIRTYTPAWLRLAGLNEHADALAFAPEVTDLITLAGVTDHISAAHSAVHSAAALAALAPTVTLLQDSVIALLDRMLTCYTTGATA